MTLISVFFCIRTGIENWCGPQEFRQTSELIENTEQSGSFADRRNSAVNSRSDTLNSGILMGCDRSGTRTIRPNAPWAAILIAHACRL